MVPTTVIADIIRVAWEMCGGERLVGAALKDPKGAVVSIRNEEFVFPGHEKDSLRFFEAGDAGYPFIGSEVENLNGVVS